MQLDRRGVGYLRLQWKPYFKLIIYSFLISAFFTPTPIFSQEPKDSEGDKAEQEIPEDGSEIPGDPREFRELRLFGQDNYKLSILVNDKNLPDGLYLWNGTQGGNRRGDRSGRPTKLLSGTFLSLIPEQLDIVSAKEQEVGPGTDGGYYTRNNGVYQQFVVFQMIEASGRKANLHKLYILRFATSSASFDSRLTEITDMQSAVVPLLPWSYEEGSFHYLKDKNALIYSLRQKTGGKETRDVTGVLYFNFAGANIHSDLPYYYEPAFDVFIPQEDLPGLVRQLPNNDIALFHPQHKNEATFTGVPFLEGAGGGQGESGAKNEERKLIYYPLTDRFKEVRGLRASGRNLEEIVFKQEARLEALSTLARTQIFSDVKARLEQFATSQNKKYLILVSETLEERVLVEERLSALLLESPTFEGRAVNLFHIRLQPEDLFRIFEVMGQKPPVALVAEGQKASEIFRKSAANEKDLLTLYLGKKDGAIPLRLVVVTTQEELDAMSGSDSRFKASDAQVVTVEVTHEDLLELAKWQWQESEVLRDVKYVETDLSNLIRKASDLDQNMKPLDRLYRLIDFIEDTVTLSESAVTEFSYEKLERLCYQFFGQPNFESQPIDFIEKLTHFEEGMGRVIFGQGEGLKQLGVATRNYYASQVSRPGVRAFVLNVGNPGVGKTYTGIQLAKYLGKEHFLIHLKDMSRREIFEQLKRYYDHHYRDGTILILDEVDKTADGSIFTFLHTILENGYFQENDMPQQNQTVSRFFGRGAAAKTYSIPGAYIYATGNFETSTDYAGSAPEKRRDQLCGDIITSWEKLHPRGSQTIKAILDRVPTLIYYPPLQNVHQQMIAAEELKKIQEEYARSSRLYLFSMSFWENFSKLDFLGSGSGRQTKRGIQDRVEALVVLKRLEDQSRLLRQSGDAASEASHIRQGPKEVYMMRLLPNGELNLLSSSDKAYFRLELTRAVWAHLRDSLYHIVMTELLKLPQGEAFAKDLRKYAESTEVVLEARVKGLGEHEEVFIEKVPLPADDGVSGEMDIKTHRILERREDLKNRIMSYGSWMLLQKHNPEVPYPVQPPMKDDRTEIYELLRRFAFYRGGDVPTTEDMGRATIDRINFPTEGRALPRTNEERMRAMADCIDRWVVQERVLDTIVSGILLEIEQQPIHHLTNVRILQPLVLRTIPLRVKTETAREVEAGRKKEDLVKDVQRLDPELIVAQKELADVRAYLYQNGGVRVIPTLADKAEQLTQVFSHSELFAKKVDVKGKRIVYLEPGVSPFLVAEAISSRVSKEKRGREVWLVSSFPENLEVRDLLKKHSDRFVLLVLNGEVPDDPQLAEIVCITMKETTKPTSSDRGVSVSGSESLIQTVVESKALYYKKNWNIEFKPQICSLIVRVCISADLASSFMDALVKFHTSRNISTFRFSGKPFLEITENTVTELLGSSDALSIGVTRGDRVVHEQIIRVIQEQCGVGLVSGFKIDQLGKFYRALINDWGRALLTSDEVDASRVAHLYPEFFTQTEREILGDAVFRGIRFTLISGGGSPYVYEGKIFIPTDTLLETMYGGDFRTQFHGILVHENFHVQGIQDETLADRLTVETLLREYGREAALSYIEFVENHSPGVVTNCLLKLLGQSEHVDRAQRGNELRDYVDFLEMDTDRDHVRDVTRRFMGREHINRIHGLETEGREESVPEREMRFHEKLTRIHVHR